jgi:hypothetical protein
MLPTSDSRSEGLKSTVLRTDEVLAEQPDCLESTLESGLRVVVADPFDVVLPSATNVYVTFLSPKSAGTVMVKTPH